MKEEKKKRNHRIKNNTAKIKKKIYLTRELDTILKSYAGFFNITRGALISYLLAESVRKYKNNNKDFLKSWNHRRQIGKGFVGEDSHNFAVVVSTTTNVNDELNEIKKEMEERVGRKIKTEEFIRRLLRIQLLQLCYKDIYPVIKQYNKCEDYNIQLWTRFLCDELYNFPEHSLVQVALFEYFYRRNLFSAEWLEHMRKRVKDDNSKEKEKQNNM